MAESFLEEIYRKADVIEKIQEAQQAAYRMWLQRSGQIWNEATGLIEKMAEETETENAGSGKRLMNAAYRAASAFSDARKFTSYISSGLIPEMFRYMKPYTGIDVSEGRYTFRSADSGFLTIYDNESGRYLHSVTDPMWEAHVLAESLYRPEMEEFHVFGAGLGYLAYQLYRLSGGAMRLYLYELNEDFTDYGARYGVLEWIDPSVLEILTGDDAKELETEFERRTKGGTAQKGSYISEWIGQEYQKLGRREFDFRRMSEDVTRWYENSWKINLWKNRRNCSLTTEQLKNAVNSGEWVVVAAGPSVGEQMEFMRESVGKRKIVAVDVILGRLLKEGIGIDLLTAVDPNEHLYPHLKGHEEQTSGIPLLANRMTYWRYVEDYQGKVCLMTPENTVERYGVGEMDGEIWDIGGTVSSLALEAAIRFGGKKIWLVGLDLAYPDGERYAKGTAHGDTGNDDGMEETESVTGDRVMTTATFLFFKSQIEAQIAMHPEIEFINLSGRGARIKGAVSGAGEKKTK